MALPNCLEGRAGFFHGVLGESGRAREIAEKQFVEKEFLVFLSSHVFQIWNR